MLNRHSAQRTAEAASGDPSTEASPTSQGTPETTESSRQGLQEAACGAAHYARSQAEAWAVVHCAERLGQRDIADALHEIVESVQDSEPLGEATTRLDAARDTALALLDACGALAGDAERT